MKKMLTTLTLLILTACSSAPTPKIKLEGNFIQSKELPKVQYGLSSKKNYVINQEKVATIGSNMIYVNEYNKFIKEEKIVVADTQREIGKRTTHRRIITIEGVEYIFSRLSYIKSHGHRYLLVNLKTGITLPDMYLGNYDGTFFKKTNHIYINKSGGYDFDYPRHRLVSRNMVENMEKKISYELIYNGTDGNSIKLSYREYAPNDTARPAFFNEVT